MNNKVKNNKSTEEINISSSKAPQKKVKRVLVKSIISAIIIGLIISIAIFTGTKYFENREIKDSTNAFNQFMSLMQEGNVNEAYKFISKNVNPATTEETLTNIQKASQPVLNSGYDIISSNITNSKNEPNTVKIIAKFKIGEGQKISTIMKKQNDEWKINEYSF